MSDSLRAILPVLVPLTTALVTVLASRRPRLQSALSFAGALALCVVAGDLLVTVDGGRVPETILGGWSAPFGIALRVDRLSAALVAISSLLALATFSALTSEREPRAPMLLPLLHGLMAGVCGAFVTADLFNLYVWFEVLLVTALGLFVVGGRRAQLDAALNYLVLNLVGTVLLLVGVGMVFGVTGHLNFDAIREAQGALPDGTRDALLPLLLVAFLIKAGAFPVFAWLPASYPTLPGPVLALFAGLLTKVGVYALLRTTADLFAPVSPAWLEGLGWVAVATMVAGVLGAAYHYDARRILAFHIISQVGYILLAVALGGAVGVAAAVVYTLHHMAVKANLLLLMGVARLRTGSFDVRRMGGLYTERPWFSVLFLVPALSLVGIPPLSGFWAKLLVLRGALSAERYVWAAAAVIVSVLTLYSMLKVWMEAFWKPHPAPDERPEPTNATGALAGGVLLAAVTLAIGFWPEPLMRYAESAAAELTR